MTTQFYDGLPAVTARADSPQSAGIGDAKARALLRPYGEETTVKLIDAVENLDSSPSIDNLIAALSATAYATKIET